MIAFSEMGNKKKQNKPPPKSPRDRQMKWKRENPESYKKSNFKQQIEIKEKRRQVRFLST